MKINKELALELWNKKEYFSKGKRGYIYLAKNNEEVFVIKTRNPESKAPNTILREYENNKSLNNHGVGPEMYYYDEELDFVIREFAEGTSIFEWMKNVNDKKIIEKVFLNLLDQCKRMDEANINKLEMNHPHKDLLIRNNEPVIIDFERCKQTIKPKNVTQLCQFLSSKHINIELQRFNVQISNESLMKLAETYKKSKQKIKEFEKIKKEIINAFKNPSSS
ncbi:hypothetical protein KO361_04520 [Candidatus Woesearchaeota archaeon]|nr:hypothetical protein [Candidatus Woesearchaeota archaeon]